MTTTTETTLRLPGTPPPWVNATVRAMLRTPGVRALLGRSFAVITVTGARTGTRYSTPVQYQRVGGRYVLTSQVHRRWWRNLRTRPEVELLVRGRVVHGRATLEEGDAAHRVLAAYLAEAPRAGRFYGLEPRADGTFAADDVDLLLEHVVVISIEPTDDPSG